MLVILSLRFLFALVPICNIVGQTELNSLEEKVNILSTSFGITIIRTFLMKAFLFISFKVLDDIHVIALANFNTATCINQYRNLRMPFKLKRRPKSCTVTTTLLPNKNGTK